jgi:hypothetical protein
MEIEGELSDSCKGIWIREFVREKVEFWAQVLDDLFYSSDRILTFVESRRFVHKANEAHIGGSLGKRKQRGVEEEKNGQK